MSQYRLLVFLRDPCGPRPPQRCFRVTPGFSCTTRDVASLSNPSLLFRLSPPDWR
jgi:hypothetical protein